MLTTADLAPMTREAMQELWAKREALRRQEEEARHRAHVMNVAREVYQRATMTASVTQRTRYMYSISKTHEGYEVLADDVVEVLRALFPGCVVGREEGAEGAEGAEGEVGIVVDWS